MAEKQNTLDDIVYFLKGMRLTKDDFRYLYLESLHNKLIAKTNKVIEDREKISMIYSWHLDRNNVSDHNLCKIDAYIVNILKKEAEILELKQSILKVYRTIDDSGTRYDLRKEKPYLAMAEFMPV